VLHWEENDLGEAFELLARRRKLVGYVVREGASLAEAEDIVQTIFLHAYQAVLAGNGPRQPRDFLARGSGPLDAATTARLVEAVGRLPPRQRDVLLLREVGGHGYAEIGRRLGLTVGGVQLLLFRAHRMLRRRLGRPRRAIGALAPLPLQQLVQQLAGLGGAGTGVVVRGAFVGVAIATAGGATTPLPQTVPASRVTSPPALVIHVWRHHVSSPPAVVTHFARHVEAHALVAVRRPAPAAKPLPATVAPARGKIDPPANPARHARVASRQAPRPQVHVSPAAVQPDAVPPPRAPETRAPAQQTSGGAPTPAAPTPSPRPSAPIEVPPLPELPSPQPELPAPVVAPLPVPVPTVLPVVSAITETVTSAEPQLTAPEMPPATLPGTDLAAHLTPLASTAPSGSSGA
jgi:DNA-directed RNA polymerase specialized sigma24 family protein